MSNRELQRRRTMGYFIKACKEILEEEGAAKLSARRVAERAGYSYATIYTYFKDMSSLLAYCIHDYLEESADAGAVSGVAPGTLEYILRSVEAYVRYYLANPMKFSVVFTMEHAGKGTITIPEELAEAFSRPPRVAMMQLEALSAYLLPRGYSPEEVNMTADICASYLHGKLSFYLHRDYGDGPEALVSTIHAAYRSILRVDHEVTHEATR
ncbi:TetR/AcrR family transcriptional regulator [Myxococcota bacterium]|nr:TetR/AcrR family transcriptional regulator [Myxococcota bacterium]MBU1536056.1 TetR/AcrR family transcriptional regulator [Myxococcota bacterium]